MKKVKLGEILDVKRGTSLPGKHYSETGKYIRLTLGNFNYPNGGFKENTSKKNIFFTGKVSSEFILKKDDIITPLTEQVSGLLGETARIPESDLYIQSGDIGLIKPKEPLDNSYAYYLVSSPMVKKQLGAAAQQTKIRHTSPEKIKDCYVWIPDKYQQEKSGRLLDQINEIIDNNNLIIKKSESIISDLYDRWFLQFDFPNENNKPYKSSNGIMEWDESLSQEIPKNWKIKKLKDLVSDDKYAIVDGPFGTQLKISEYDKSGNIPIYEMEQLDNSFITTKFKHFINEKKYQEIKRSTVRNGDIVISKTGTLGLLGIVNSDFEKGILVSRLAKITPDEKKLGRYSLFQILLHLSKSNYWIMKSSGSTMPILNNSLIENISVLYPDNNLYKKYEDKVSKLYDLIYKCKIQNNKLVDLRDTLLPLFINGQLKIED